MTPDLVNPLDVEERELDQPRVSPNLMVHRSFVEDEMNKHIFRLQDRELERINWRLIVVTVAMALLYLAVSIWQALKGSGGAENLNAALSVHPRSIILMCWVAAAIGVAFMPEIGKIFAALALLAVVALFGYWGYATWVIKSNLTPAEFGPSGFTGQFFIGATIFDLATLLVAIAIGFYDVKVIYKNLQGRFKKNSLLNAPPPAVMAK